MKRISVPKYRCSTKSMQHLYNIIYRFYGIIEKHLTSFIDSVLEKKVKPIENRLNYTALEYACGSGLLTLKLAGLFKYVKAKDISSGILKEQNCVLKKAD